MGDILDVFGRDLRFCDDCRAEFTKLDANPSCDSCGKQPAKHEYAPATPTGAVSLEHCGGCGHLVEEVERLRARATTGYDFVSLQRDEALAEVERLRKEVAELQAELRENATVRAHGNASRADA